MPDLETWSTGRLLSTAARLSEHALNAALSEIGVTPAGVNVLTALNTHGAVAQNELAELLRVQPQTISKTIERLEASGHLSRRRSGPDRRVRLVVISSKGRETLEQAQDIEKKLADVPTTQGYALRRSLQAIIDYLTSSGK
ncbi:MarR family winged helix-turn-helix transcriptional regulator [Arthrobacter sp. AET 35A]|uniref:MarR family winged helix-turn-helix transcriptional regulator n=1 Tax=Arthrobacter sp. AET 35A TaxID=2292643 RepID=UPI00177C1C5C|nr:MarR family transcriptional regulator [Arthrobacter sp. AET 35A]MBE0011111.1 MarR family transcriptional regulator [Arthrobacter sp. AET 35A]